MEDIKSFIESQWNFGENDGSEIRSMSWDLLPNFSRDFVPSYTDCPDCWQTADKLQWYKFRTCQRSWNNLAGSAGYFSICQKCNIYVQLITTKRG